MKGKSFKLQVCGINFIFLHKARWRTAQLNRSFLSDLSAVVALQCRSWMFNGNVGCFGPAELGLLLDRNILTQRQRTAPNTGSHTQPPTSKQPSALEKLGEYWLHFCFHSSTLTHFMTLFDFGHFSDLTDTLVLCFISCKRWAVIFFLPVGKSVMKVLDEQLQQQKPHKQWKNGQTKWTKSDIKRCFEQIK